MTNLLFLFCSLSKNFQCLWPTKDASILVAAVGCKAELLVTGDKTHFGLFYNRVLEGIEIVDLRTALERLIA